MIKQVDHRTWINEDHIVSVRVSGPFHGGNESYLYVTLRTVDGKEFSWECPTQVEASKLVSKIIDHESEDNDYR